jgi:hypothetical protein
MKKLICITLLMLLLSSIQNFGQSAYRSALQKGSVLTGGSLSASFGTSKYEYSSQYGSGNNESGYTSFTLTPKAGFFLADGVALGLGFDLTSTIYKYFQHCKL